MPLPKGNEALQTTLDSQLTSIFAQVQPKMAAYVAGKGWYFQGIETASAPADGALADQVDTKAPTYDAASTWKALGITLPAKMAMSVAVDNYHGPKGKDWALRGSVIISGKRYVKTLAGNKTEAKDSDWIQLP